MSNQPCTIDDCRRHQYARTWCDTHYRHYLQTGDPRIVPSRRIDEIAVDRATAGQQPGRLTVGERELAVRRLHATGLSDRKIADLLGIGRTSVLEIRRRLGLPANRLPVGDCTGRLA